MMHHIEVQYLFHGTLNILDAWITKFYHLMALRTNQMIMLLVTIGFFVLRKIFSELMFAYQIALHQKIQCIIHRRAAYPVIFILHADIERLNIKVALTRIDLLQDRVALRRLSQLLIFQVSCKNLFYLFVYFWIDHHSN